MSQLLKCFKRTQVDKYSTVKTIAECTLCLGLTTEDIRHLYVLLSSSLALTSDRDKVYYTLLAVLSVSLALQVLLYCLALTLIVKTLPDTDIAEQFNNVAFVDAYQPEQEHKVINKSSSLRKGCIQFPGHQGPPRECPVCMRWLNDLLAVLALTLLLLHIAKSGILGWNNTFTNSLTSDIHDCM